MTMKKAELIEQFQSLYESVKNKTIIPLQTRQQLGKLLCDAEKIELSISQLAQIIDRNRRTVSDWKKLYIETGNKELRKPIKAVTKTAIKPVNKPTKKTKSTSLSLEKLVELSKSKPMKKAKYKDYHRSTIYIEPTTYDKLKVLKEVTHTDLSEMTNKALDLYIEKLRIELNI